MNTSKLIQELFSLMLAAIKGASTIAEVRKRLSDGIQDADIISDDALRRAISAKDDAEGFIDNG